MNKQIRFPELYIEIRLRVFWEDYDMLFFQIFKQFTTEPYKVVSQDIFRDRTIPTYITLENITSDQDDKNTRFQMVLKNFTQNIDDPLIKISPNYHDLTSLMKFIEKIDENRAKIIGLIEYYWLLEHKPKHINDNILHELDKIRPDNVSSNWKKLLIKCVQLHKSIYKKIAPHLDESMGTKDDPILNIHRDFILVLDKIEQLITVEASFD